MGCLVDPKLGLRPALYFPDVIPAEYSTKGIALAPPSWIFGLSIWRWTEVLLADVIPQEVQLQLILDI